MPRDAMQSSRRSSSTGRRGRSDGSSRVSPRTSVVSLTTTRRCPAGLVEPCSPSTCTYLARRALPSDHTVYLTNIRRRSLFAEQYLSWRRRERRESGRAARLRRAISTWTASKSPRAPRRRRTTTKPELGVGCGVFGNFSDSEVSSRFA